MVSSRLARSAWAVSSAINFIRVDSCCCDAVMLVVTPVSPENRAWLKYGISEIICH